MEDLKRKSNAPGWILAHSKKFLPAILLLTVLTAVSAVGYVFLALLSSQVIDIATGAAGNLWQAVAALFGLVLVLTGVHFWCGHLRVHISSKMDMALKDHLLRTFLNKKYSQIYRIHSGEILNLFTADIDIVVSGVVSMLPQSISTVTKIVAGLVALVVINPYFAAVIAVLGLLLALCGWTIGPYYKKMHKSVQKSVGVVRGFLQECAENSMVIKSFATKQPVLDRLQLYMQDSYRLKIRRNHLSNAVNTGIFLLFTAGYYLTLVWGATQIAAGALTFGALTALLQIVSQIRAPFYNISGVLPQFYGMLASAERLMDLETYDDEPAPTEKTPARLYTHLQGIAAQGLQFAYSADTPVLTDGDFFLPKGGITVITGPSGVGKSTLFKLLLGLFEPSGGQLALRCEAEDIPIDAAVRRMFAYVPQGNMIFSGTIRENIAFYHPTASDAEILAAAKTAAVGDLLAELPEGLDTVLSEHGVGLSEGQIQRLAIARALLCDAPILLLDEATSALDEDTERVLLQNLQALGQKTVLLISHKPCALEICDHHLVLEDTVLKLVK